MRWYPVSGIWILLFINLSMYWFAVYATRLVFGGWFSIDNSRFHHSNDNLEIHKMDKIGFLYINNHIIHHSGCYNLHEWIRGHIYGITRVSAVVDFLSFLCWIINSTFLAYRITRYAHWFSEQYHSIYIPFYANLTSFLIGMVGGILYYRHKQGHIDLTKSKVCFVAVSTTYYLFVMNSLLIDRFPF